VSYDDLDVNASGELRGLIVYSTAASEIGQAMRQPIALP
jgi:hypothetical protein